MMKGLTLLPILAQQKLEQRLGSDSGTHTLRKAEPICVAMPKIPAPVKTPSTGSHITYALTADSIAQRPLPAPGTSRAAACLAEAAAQTGPQRGAAVNALWKDPCRMLQSVAKHAECCHTVMIGSHQGRVLKRHFEAEAQNSS